MTRECRQLLTDLDGYQARCTQPYGVEHTHHDLTAREAARAELAECVQHDWDTASPGVHVCDVCHLVREDPE